MPGLASGEIGSGNAGPRGLSLAELAQRCQRAAGQYERGQPNPADEYCFEMLRRAICEADQSAWAHVLAQYRGLVLSHVRRHPWTRSAEGDAEYWVNRTFERFWKAIGADRFEQFPDLPSLLSYLVMCVHSVVVTEVRARRGMHDLPLDEAPDVSSAADAVEGSVADGMDGVELWRIVDAELSDERERVVAHLSFVLDMKPGEIQVRHPGYFADVVEVYRVKRNVLERLRRSTRLRAFLA